MTDEAEATQEVERSYPRPKGHPEDLPWPPKWREYPEDHPARRDETPSAPFNEGWAREDFGDAFVDELKKKQGRFRGDWWLLAMLLRCAEAAAEIDPDARDKDRFRLWNSHNRQIFHPGRWAHLEYANLHCTRLDHANLFGARLDNADLYRARLDHTNLYDALLRHADLRNARLEHADLRYTVLHHAKLTHARLDHADVRRAAGLLFDQNPADRLHIEGNAPDPWSQLRQEYTGPRFFFHLLLLIAFVLPFGARVLHLSALAEIHHTAERMVEEEAETSAVDRTAPDPAIAAIRSIKERFEETHSQAPAAWVLIGGAKGWIFIGLTAVLVIYNTIRLILTSQVAALRDAEERSKIMPALVEYYGVCHPRADRNELLTGEESDRTSRQPPQVRDWPRIWMRRIGEWRRGPNADDFYEIWAPSQGLDAPDGPSGAWRRRHLHLLSPLPVIGLYRVHQFARILFWVAVASFVINTIAWAATTWVWLPQQ